MMPIDPLQPEPHLDAELIEGLEPDQIVASTSRPLPRMPLGHIGETGLWALRIFVLIVTAMVVYTFIVSLPVFVETPAAREKTERTFYGFP